MHIDSGPYTNFVEWPFFGIIQLEPGQRKAGKNVSYSDCNCDAVASPARDGAKQANGGENATLLDSVIDIWKYFLDFVVCREFEMLKVNTNIE